MVLLNGIPRTIPRDDITPKDLDEMNRKLEKGGLKKVVVDGTGNIEIV